MKSEVRSCAIQAILAIEDEGAFVDIVLGKLAQSPEIPGADFALLQNWVRGVIQRSAQLDAILRPLLKDPRKLPPFVRQLLRLGAYQIRFMDQVPVPVVVHESVELAKSEGFPGLAGLVNAVLRKVKREESERKGEDPSSDRAQSETVVPAWIFQRWVIRYGLQEAQALSQACLRPAALFFRVNTLRTNSLELKSLLSSRGYELELASFAKDCLRVVKASRSVRIQDLPEFQQGLFFVQDQSSTLVGECLPLEGLNEVIDLCAAPGGKACSLAMRLQDRGRIVAVDVNQKRLALIQANAERLGLKSIETFCADARFLNLERRFNAALVDAPCSGFGVLGRKPDMMRKRKESDLPALVELQTALLESSLKLVVPGGHLLYSTCTIEPEENGGLIEAFCRRHPEIERRALQNNFPDVLLDADQNLSLFPHQHAMAGAFGALLKIRAAG